MNNLLDIYLHLAFSSHCSVVILLIKIKMINVSDMEFIIEKVLCESVNKYLL